MNTQPKYWRTLAELENAPEVEEFLAREFPDAATTEPGSTSRRRFLQLMGASFALAGAATGCRWEKENILPYARRPEGLEPGAIRYFTTGIELQGAMQALQVACFDNRPYKVEPHPGHPYSTGGTDAYGQATMLELFDPDRSNSVLNKNAESSAEAFTKFARPHFEAYRGAKQGKGLRILAGATSSPSVARLKANLSATMPEAKWVVWESLSRDTSRLGAQTAFGAPHDTHLDLSKAKVIVSLDDDIFGTHPARLRLARDWAQMRRVDDADMNRMYVVESRYTATGATADHRLGIRAEQVKAFTLALESAVKEKLGQGTGPDRKGFLADGDVAKHLDAIASDLAAHKGQSVVTVGHNQPAEVHALAHRLNATLQNAGKTVLYTASGETPDPQALTSLVAEMNAGQVETLVLLGTNPAYDAPGDVDFAAAMSKVQTTIHHGLYVDETAELATWHVPATHFLESWGDGRTYDGTVTIAQPMITPLFNGTSRLELLSMMTGAPNVKGLDIVKGTMASLAEARAAAAAAATPDEGSEAPAEVAGDAPETKTSTQTDDAELKTARSAAAAFRASFDWRKTVHDGFVADTAYPTVTPALVAFDVAAPAERAYKASKTLTSGELEVTFYDDGKVYDGRFANNGWLQETPDFMTKLTWDNAAVVGPVTAKALGLKDEQLVDVAIGAKKVKLPVYIMPGQPTGSVAVAVGYGRRSAGVVGGYTTKGFEQVGFDVGPLRSTQAMYFVSGASVSPAGGTYRLASTQTHNMIDATGMQAIQNRAPVLVRTGSVEEFKADPSFAKKKDHLQKKQLFSLFEERDWSKAKHQWGMSIDLSKCVGCNACVVSCTSENNVPIVGKKEVLNGREMHWMRIDRYFTGDFEAPEVAHMPMACAHCENAPCEQVCPVGATIHSAEGTNDMAYNRCIGTRYCANNCPYKVRRFNFHNYHQDLKAPENGKKMMVFNPDVTVRFRGVMEKCSYCTQRIHYAKRTAKIENRSLQDGDIVTACQSACPTGAIIFGDLKDEKSRVRKAQELGRSYAVLQELNIKPRTEYLAKIKNPNPALASQSKGAASGHAEG